MNSKGRPGDIPRRTSEVIPGSYAPNQNQQRRIAVAFKTISREESLSKGLLRYNLTFEGITELIRVGRRYMSTEAGVFIRANIMEYQGKKFAVLWPGRLAEHDEVRDLIQNILPGAIRTKRETIEAKRDLATNEFVFDSSTVWAKAKTIADLLKES